MKITGKKILSLLLSAALFMPMVSAMPVYAEETQQEQEEHEHMHDGVEDDVFNDSMVVPDEDFEAKPIITVSATEDDGVDGGVSLDKSTFCDIPTVTVEATEGRTVSSVTVLRNGEPYDMQGVEMGKDTVTFRLSFSENAKRYVADTFVINAHDSENKAADPVTIQAFITHNWAIRYNGRYGRRENVDYHATCTAPKYTAVNYYCSVCGDVYATYYNRPKLGEDGTYDYLPEGRRPKGHTFTEESITNGCGTYVKKTCEECGFVVIEEGESHHVWGDELLTKPSDCDTDGYTYRVCSECNEYKSEDTVSSTGHKFGSWYTTREAVCGTKGERERKCQICGDKETEPILSPENHSFRIITVKAATCDKAGTRESRCVSCKYVDPNSIEEIPPLGHNWEDIPGTNTATCVKDGTKQQKCSVCNEEQTVEAEAYGDHVWQGVLKKAASCTEEGIMEYTCKRCGQIRTESIEKTEHTYPTRRVSCTSTVNCTVCGTVLKPAGTHTFEQQTYGRYNHWSICTVCGDKFLEPHDEDPDGNCTTSYVCRCGYTVPAKASHIYSGSNDRRWDENYHWYVCVTDGCTQKINLIKHYGGSATCSKKAVCTGCGAEYGDYDTTKHGDTEIKNAVEPEVGKEGYSGDVYCLDCNQVIKKGESVPAIPPLHEHKFDILMSDGTGHWHECECGVKADDFAAHEYGSSIAAEGGHYRMCRVCSHKTEVLAHTAANDDGDCETAVVCIECNAIVIPAKTHNFNDDYTADEYGHYHMCANPDCNVTDTKIKHSGGTADCANKAVCEICGTEYGSENPSNHTGGTLIERKTEAGEFTEGYTGDECCAGCGEILKKGEVIPPIGHSYKWHSDSTHHWQQCETCGDEIGQTAHIFGEYKKTAEGHTHECEICGYVSTENHVPALSDKNCETPLKCTVCEYEIESAKEHTWGEQFIFDGHTHTKKCINADCGVSKTEEHTGGKATCITLAECEICHAKYGTPDTENHANQNYIVTDHREATETEDGYTGDKVCADCYAVIEKGETIPALGVQHYHSWSEVKFDEQGHWRECTECGAYESETKTQHSYTDSYDGNTDVHWLECTVCGYRHSSAHIPYADDGDCTTAVLCSVCGMTVFEGKEAHNFDGIYFSDETGHWHICTNEGCRVEQDHVKHTGGTASCVNKAVCSECGEEYGDIDKTRHLNTEIHGYNPPTEFEAGYSGDTYCSDCGVLISRGEAIAPLPPEQHTHSFIKANSDDTHHWLECEVCGAHTSYELHTFGDYTLLSDGHYHTCTECGKTVGAPHTPIEDDKNCSTPLSCSDCGYIIEAAVEHTWGEWTSESGHHKKECLNPNCDVEETGIHSGGVATCKSEAVCSVCGIAYGEKNSGNHTGTVETRNYKPATETEAGYSGDIWCLDCEHIISFGVEIPKLEPEHVHTWSDNWETDGTHHWKVCTECGNHDPASLVEHKFSAYLPAEGGHSRTCEICGYTDTTEPHIAAADDGNCETPVLCEVCGMTMTAALQHNFGGIYFSDKECHWHICTNEGCTVLGEKIKHSGGVATCVSAAVCGECGEYYGAADPDGHIGNTEITGQKPATETEDGYSGDVICMSCKKLLTKGEVIPKLDHVHNYNKECSDETGHWLECSCGAIMYYEKHSYNYVPDGNGHKGICAVCGYEGKTEAHNPEKDDGNCETPVLCSDCGATTKEAVKHVFDGDYAYDGNGHWLMCTNPDCNAAGEKQPHRGGEATCSSLGVCADCDREYGTINPDRHTGNTEIVRQKPATETEEGYTGDTVCTDCGHIIMKGEVIPKLGHVHNYDTECSDGTHHWKECSCGEKTGYEEHTFTYRPEDNGHTEICTVCGYVGEIKDHTPNADDGNCETPVLCALCGATVTEGRQHIFGGEYGFDEEGHYLFCTNEGCSFIGEKQPHEGGEATCVSPAKCSVCGESYGEVDPDRHTGNEEITGQKPATETEEGYTGDTVCSDCGQIITKGEVIPKLGHVHNYDTECSDETHHWKECSCGEKTDYEEHTFTYRPEDNGHTEICTVCGYVGQILDHTPGKEATCVSPAICLLCNSPYGDVDPDNHTETEVRGFIEATQESEGYTGDTYCVGCGSLISEGSIIPKKPSNVITDADSGISAVVPEDKAEYYEHISLVVDEIDDSDTEYSSFKDSIGEIYSEFVMMKVCSPTEV